MAENHNRSPRKSKTGPIKWIFFSALVALAALASSRTGTAQPSRSIETASAREATGAGASANYAGEDPAVAFERSRRARRITIMAPRSVVQAHRAWLAAHAAASSTQGGSAVNSTGFAGGNVDLPANQYQGETAIAINPNTAQQLVGGANTFLADPNCAPPTGSNGGTEALYGSTDGGNTWTLNCAPWPSSLNQGTQNTSFGSDPAVAWDSAGKAYAAYLLININCTATSCDNASASDAIEIATSSNSGTTWSSLGQVVNNLGIATVFEDKEMIAVDTGNTSPHPNRLYVIWDEGSASGQFERVAHSDSGATGSWTTTQVDSDTTFEDIGGAIAVGPDGTVYAIWNRLSFDVLGSQTGETTVFSKSSDGGNTWTAPATIATHTLFSFGTNNTPPAQDLRGTNAFGAIAIDRDGTSPHNGNLYVVYTDYASAAAAPNDTNIYLVRSTDGGNTWSSPLEVNDDGATSLATQFFPWVDVDQSSGAVGVSWYDTRNDGPPSGQFRKTQIFAAQSADGGATFSANLQVSNPSTQFAPNPAVNFSDENSTDNTNANPNQYGDYAQIAFSAGIAHPLWCDSRNFFPNVSSNPPLDEDAATAQVNFTASSTPTATPSATPTPSSTPTPVSAKLIVNPPKTANFPTQVTLGGQGAMNKKPVKVALRNSEKPKNGVAIQIESVQVSGPGFSFWPQSPSNPCAGTLNPGKTCIVQLAFAPTQTGASEGSLLITDNTSQDVAAGGRTIALHGTGKQGRLQYGPTSLGFSAKVGSTSPTRTVTLRNRNPVPMSVGNPSVDNSDFLISGNCLSPIAPGGTCQEKVSFRPSASGTVHAHLFFHDDAVGAPHKVNLTGTGK